MIKGDPPQLPTVETGVTMYCTDPAAELEGLFSTWLMVPPLAALAPVTPPVMLPIDQLNEEAVLEVSVILAPVPLQISVTDGFVTTGVGFTVTVIVYALAEEQFPVVEVGVTRYSTDPAVVLDGLESVWLMEFPLPAVAPVIPPDTAPIVHAKVDGVLALSVIFGFVLLQIVTAFPVVIAGVGFTVTVIVNGAPAQPPAMEVGVTIYSTVPAALLLGFTNVWPMVFPALATAPVIPPVMVPIVQVNVEGVLAVSAMFGLVLLQVEATGELVTAGIG